MKKIILTAAALSLFLVANIASASSLKDIIPAITEVYFELNTTTKNPIQEYLLTNIPSQFADSVFLDADYELEKSATQLDQEEKQKESIIKAYSEIITNNTLSVGLSLSDDVEIGIKITDIQYQNFIDALGTKATVESENPKIYLTRENFFFTKSGDLFLSAPTKENLLSIINDTEDKLSTNQNYKNISSEFNTNDTLNLYISNSIFNSFFKDNPESLNLATSLTDSFKSFGLTFNQTINGINSKIITTFDTEKAKKSGLNSTDTNFIPLLYKYLPSENPIFYTEFSNLKSTITTATNLAIKTGEFTASALKIPTEIETYLSILEKEIAIYVQKDTQILPAVTIILNTSTHKDTAKEITTKLITALEDELKSRNIEYQQSTNKNLTTFIFDLNKLDPAGEIPEGMNKISITLGITAEDYLLFSTYSKIASKYGEGLTKNSAFKNAFTNLNQTIAGIFYFNIKNSADWYDKILDIAQKTNTTEFAKKQISNTRELLKIAQKPWQDISMINKITETLGSTEINLNFDINSLDLTYIETIDDLFNSSEESTLSFMNSRETFNDTTANDWYYQDLRELNARGVITGYADQSFKPTNNITRAEYLTMILRAFDSEKYYTNTVSPFTDVSPDDWFFSAVVKGKENGLIKGYDDNSFHPNSPISRAEAVSILHKAIKFRFGEDVKLPRRSDTGNFSDVKYNDWYYNDVLSLYDYSIIDGEKDSYNFFPYRNLNRAEASKIINKTLQAIDEPPQQIQNPTDTEEGVLDRWQNLTGTPPIHPELGSKNAPVVVEEFADYQCPACQIFHQQIFPSIKEKYVDTGKVKFVYYNFPLTSIHEYAYPAAKFAQCSFRKSDNSKFLEIQDKLYETMTDGKFDYDIMSKFANSIKINKFQLKKCFDNDTYEKDLSYDRDFAEINLITGTPGFIVNGTTIGNSSELEEAINEELKKLEIK